MEFYQKILLSTLLHSACVNNIAPLQISPFSISALKSPFVILTEVKDQGLLTDVYCTIILISNDFMLKIAQNKT